MMLIYSKFGTAMHTHFLCISNQMEWYCYKSCKNIVALVETCLAMQHLDATYVALHAYLI